MWVILFVFVIDFSDYGFFLIYFCDKVELFDLFDMMVVDCEDYDLDVIVIEIVDGVL